MPQAQIITIGDELLIGQVIDTNSAWIAQALQNIGIETQTRIAIGDNEEAIINALDQALSKVECIIVTGGLGPTADDITKTTLNKYFNSSLVVDQATEDHIKNLFSTRGRPLLQRNLDQALIPKACKVLFNQLGTAPGMLFEKDGCIIIALPGVPYEMKGLMTHQVLPILQKAFKKEMHILHSHLLCCGEGESFIAEKIKDLEAALPQSIALAYLPAPFMVRLRLSAKGQDEHSLASSLQYHSDAIAQRLGTLIYARTDESLAQVVCNTLKAHNLTISVAESCTAGLIAHQLTQYDGASNYFIGGILAYATQIKTSILNIDPNIIKQFGVVSQETAIAMAQKVCQLFNTDIGLGITGILSESAYEDASPVGTVHIAVVAKNGTVFHKEIKLLKADRQQNKESASQLALVCILDLIRLLKH